MTMPPPAAAEVAPPTLLPDLATPIGLAGTMRHAEVAGALSLETGTLIAIMIYAISEQ